MKRALILAAAACAAAIVSFSGCGPKVPARPDDFDLDYWITDDVSEADFSGYTFEAGWFGARACYTPGSELLDRGGGFYEPAGKYVQYVIGAWPDYADGGEYVTRIIIADPDISVYGITCNSTFEQFDEVMQRQGYEITERSQSSHSAEYGRVTISLGGGVLRIRAEVTNRDGIVF